MFRWVDPRPYIIEIVVGDFCAEKSSQKTQGSPPQAFVFAGANPVYCGFLRTGGFLGEAEPPFFNSAPFSMTMTKGLGV
jgi:hypothetical protein